MESYVNKKMQAGRRRENADIQSDSKHKSYDTCPCCFRFLTLVAGLVANQEKFVGQAGTFASCARRNEHDCFIASGCSVNI